LAGEITKSTMAATIAPLNKRFFGWSISQLATFLVGTGVTLVLGYFATLVR